MLEAPDSILSTTKGKKKKREGKGRGGWQSTEWEKYLQMTYFRSDLYSE
jgi:hypothetical protein